MKEAWNRLHTEVWWGNTIEKVYENYDGWWWGGNILNDLWQISSEDIQGWMKLGLNFIQWLVECCGSDTALVLPQRPRDEVTQMMVTSRLPTISLLLYFPPVLSWLLRTSTKRLSLTESSEQTTYSNTEEYCQARWRDTTVQESTDQIDLP